MSAGTKVILVGKRQECADVATFVFKADGVFEFTAGQYAIFNFDLDGKTYTKHFTISSSPKDAGLEFTTILTGSDYKKALESLRAGHEFYLKGPYGKFSLEAAEKESLCFLAGGIGVTPIRSILRFADQTGIKINGAVFYSNRTAARIAFKKDFDDIVSRNAGLRIFYTLTDLSGEEKRLWRGGIGRIDSEMIKRDFPRFNESHFFVSGPPGFVDAMKKSVIPSLGVAPELVTAENFTGYK
jgi:ferredoxin-NADP reductase